MTRATVNLGEPADARGCWIRPEPGRPYHPYAPPGFSICGVCNRLILRGFGRWWEGRWEPS